MMEMFDMVTVAPLVALFENAICMTYYSPVTIGGTLDLRDRSRSP
jgi:hypothetical protein